MHFAEKATGYEAKSYPGNKKSPLIQGLDEFNHKTANYASKKGGIVPLSPLAEGV